MQSIGIPWNDGDALGKLNDWISWLGWSLTAFGVLLTALSLWVGQRVSTLEAESSRVQAERILELEEKTRAPTSAERLFTLFERIDKKFHEAVKSGQYTFTAAIRSRFASRSSSMVRA